jgi:hypothetical protein
MRLIPFVLIALSLCVPTTALAQEWEDYEDVSDRFRVNTAGDVQVREFLWDSEYGLQLPAREHSFRRGAERYSITVVDYNDAERMYRNQDHPPSFSQAAYWQIDILGSIQYAATKLFRQRPGATVTYDAWHYIDLVEGHQLHVTNADSTRTTASIYLHENRLYILEATVPEGAPEPALFINALSFLDANGERVRYDEIYQNPQMPATLDRGGNPIGGGGGGGGRGGGQGQ